jgi:hypothetical protein
LLGTGFDGGRILDINPFLGFADASLPARARGCADLAPPHAETGMAMLLRPPAIGSRISLADIEAIGISTSDFIL